MSYTALNILVLFVDVNWLVVCLAVSFLWRFGLPRLAASRDQHSLQTGPSQHYHHIHQCVHAKHTRTHTHTALCTMQTSVKMKLLCAQVVKEIVGDSIDVRTVTLPMQQFSQNLHLPTTYLCTTAQSQNYLQYITIMPAYNASFYFSTLAVVFVLCCMLA